MIMIKSGLKGTIQELASILKISEPSVMNKLKGRQEFKVGEIRLMAIKFNLSPEQICDIFIWR